MIHKVVLPVKCPLTDSTLVRPYVCMNNHVLRQLAGSRKPLGAQAAGVGAFTCMRPHMTLQSTVLPKRGRAEFALKGAIACVDAFMEGAVATVLCGVVAIMTLEGLEEPAKDSSWKECIRVRLFFSLPKSCAMETWKLEKYSIT